MTTLKFSLGDIVWCKSPASNNVWPARIFEDKVSGRWQKDGKAFLVFYGKVKCQAGKWIPLSNVVAFKDISELPKSSNAALVAAFKKAKEEFDNPEKEKSGVPVL